LLAVVQSLEVFEGLLGGGSPLHHHLLDVLVNGLGDLVVARHDTLLLLGVLLLSCGRGYMGKEVPFLLNF
jgi:hypothetical protein